MSIQDALAARARKLAECKPETIHEIKLLAKKLKKHYGYAHTVALNNAAKQAGYLDFQAARYHLITLIDEE